MIKWIRDSPVGGWPDSKVCSLIGFLFFGANKVGKSNIGSEARTPNNPKIIIKANSLVIILNTIDKSVNLFI